MSSRVRLLHEDNLVALDRLLEDETVRGKVALAYLDPPYGTGRDFGAYDDRWEGGRHGLVDMLRPRLERLHRLLADDGSILVHVDPRIAHLVAIALDELFGPGDRDPRANTPRPGFRNEIIWTYGLGGSSSRVYPRKHDVILWYTKGSDWCFDPPRIPARSQLMKGQDKKQLDVWLGPPQLEDESPIFPSDVLDVAAINNRAKERVGYPTQKPLALLRPLVRAHTRAGALVLDPFCGSGTTVVAAALEGRDAIGIDLGNEAIVTARARLMELGIMTTS
ncbi:MAG: DNA-methyltransferase [Polyangiales bacterium]